MGFNPVIPVGNLVEYSRGGGWGKETPFEGSSRVAIIRGADFPSVAQGSYGGLPVRYEKDSKVNSVTLRAGDIVLENSGGTDSRPTGRTVFVTNELIDAYDCPVIPASFCRLLRFDNRANSEFVYYWLQEMYSAGRTWGYQNRSTGLSNFQYKVFADSELLPDLPIEVQSKIASVLSAFEKKIRENNRQNDYLAELLDVLFVDMLNDADASWERLSLLDIASYKNGLAMQKFRPAPGDPGLPVLKIKELGQGVCTPDSERCASTIDESVKIHDGNLVFSWSGTLLLDFWAGGDAGLNQHLFKVTSDRYPSWLYYLWTKHHMDRFIMLAKDRATTMGHIKRSALAESEVLIPPVEQLEVLTRRMQPIVDELVVNKIQSRNLAGLRDVLLPKLMSGEIDVSNVRLSMPPNNHLSAG